MDGVRLRRVFTDMGQNGFMLQSSKYTPALCSVLGIDELRCKCFIETGFSINANYLKTTTKL